MLKVQYGTIEIPFIHKINNRLKNNYITVDAKEGVVLKSPQIEQQLAMDLVKKKARWIVNKLELVDESKSEDIVTGSRLPYLGKKYYVQIIITKGKRVSVRFTYSKFQICVGVDIEHKQQAITKAIENFYRQKTQEKLIPRIHLWINRTGLKPNEVQVRKMSKRWGSCTNKNKVIFNYNLVKLSFPLIDYVIVHELCHIKIKNHSQVFWKEISKFIPNYKLLDSQILLV